MSRRKKPKAELAKVIPFRDEFRSGFADDSRRQTETAAVSDWCEALRLSDVTKSLDPQDKIEAFYRAVKRALVSVYSAKVSFDLQFGDGIEANADNADLLIRYGERLKLLKEWFDWCETELTRFAPEATLYNLAEFRRFRNRVVRKGATP